MVLPLLRAYKIWLLPILLLSCVSAISVSPFALPIVHNLDAVAPSYLRRRHALCVDGKGERCHVSSRSYWKADATIALGCSSTDGEECHADQTDGAGGAERRERGTAVGEGCPPTLLAAVTISEEHYNFGLVDVATAEIGDDGIMAPGDIVDSTATISSPSPWSLSSSSTAISSDDPPTAADSSSSIHLIHFPTLYNTTAIHDRKVRRSVRHLERWKRYCLGDGGVYFDRRPRTLTELNRRLCHDLLHSLLPFRNHRSDDHHISHDTNSSTASTDMHVDVDVECAIISTCARLEIIISFEHLNHSSSPDDYYTINSMNTIIERSRKRPHVSLPNRLFHTDVSKDSPLYSIVSSRCHSLINHIG